jgi:hypothetical protein
MRHKPLKTFPFHVTCNGKTIAAYNRESDAKRFAAARAAMYPNNNYQVERI